MDLRECYRTLGLDERASPEQVRRAYLDLVKVWHPDRFDCSPLLKGQAEENFKRVNAAYTRLRRHLPSRPAAPVATAFPAGRGGTLAYRLLCAYRSLRRRLRYRRDLLTSQRQQRRLRQRTARGRPANTTHGGRTTGGSFREVLDQLRHDAGRERGSGARGRAADAGMRWLRVVEQRRRRRAQESHGDALDPVGPVERSRRVGRLRRRP